VRKTALLFFMVCLSGVSSLDAEESVPPARPLWYAGINPIALGQFLPGNISPVVTAIGFLSGAESGIALYGGREVERGHALEIRLSTGPLNQVWWDTQAQAGWLWYPCEMWLGWEGGPVAGIFLRNIGLANRFTGVWVLSLVPEINIGWRFWARPVAVDLRLGWNACALSWSTMPRTRPGIDWITFPYCFSLSAGVAIGW
jgi:hypothetical protein